MEPRRNAMLAKSISTASANQRSSGHPCVSRNEKSYSFSAQTKSAPGTSASLASQDPRKIAVSLTGSRPAPSKPRGERTIATRKRECSLTKSASSGVSENLTRVRSTQQNVSESMMSIDCVDVPVCDNSSAASQDFMQQCCESRASENSDERPDPNSADRLLHAGQAAYAMRSFGTQTNERSSSAAFLQSKKWHEKEKALKAQNERLRSTVDAYKKELERLKEECHVSKFFNVVRDSELACTKAKFILNQVINYKATKPIWSETTIRQCTILGAKLLKAWAVRPL
ncbi:hypothetical protein HPB51_012118 [Rhipicephalus microplus]|uniref:Uncharacterized protein n=1 Tax=Rhipicephalus microplus TaxID=6941 RepID=A0A9J6DUQ6_RHIMP|nr:hypothetical protein HPB51_012118 [Rhipicephalus microplus]